MKRLIRASYFNKLYDVYVGNSYVYHVHSSSEDNAIEWVVNNILSKKEKKRYQQDPRYLKVEEVLI